jgi:phospholipid-translocating ATPase
VECEVAFQALKAALCTAPVLISPDFQKEFIVQTDASHRGLGAVFSQLDEQGHNRPVAYYSHKLLPREEKYSAVEKECLAI